MGRFLDLIARQVWYTDASSGFWDVQLSKSVWPDPTSIPAAKRKNHKRTHRSHRRR